MRVFVIFFIYLTFTHFHYDISDRFVMNTKKNRMNSWKKPSIYTIELVDPTYDIRFHEGDSQLQSLIAEFTRHCYFWHIIIKCQTLSLQLNRIQSIDWKHPGRCGIGTVQYSAKNNTNDASSETNNKIFNSKKTDTKYELFLPIL